MTTPNILTEVSNLLGQIGDHLKPTYFGAFARALTHFPFDEHYSPSNDIVGMPEFINFGLTDAGIMNVAKNNYLVVTVDWPLSQYLLSIGLGALNFNHIRTMNWT